MKLKDLNLATSLSNYQITCGLGYLETIIKDYEEGDGLQINPDFQRGHVWTEKQQVDFIKFIINNPTKRQTLYFNFSDTGKKDMVLVDGLQRLTAFRKFIADKLKVHGRYFTEFEDHEMFLRRCNIEININNLKTREEVLKWYIEMNSGGTPHSQEEIDRVIKLYDQEIKNV